MPTKQNSMNEEVHVFSMMNYKLGKCNFIEVRRIVDCWLRILRLCGFTRKEILIVHNQTHTIQKVYSCPQCDKHFI